MREQREQITPARTYLLVGAALLVLLALTVLAASVDLGPFNTVIAVTIAVIKALLVILFFMNVRRSSRITWIYVLIGFFWLVLLFGLTLGDYITRPWLPIPR